MSIDKEAFVPTIGGRGQRHVGGLVGHLFKIKDPSTVRVGNCFMAGRLREGDVVLCVDHSGDCFQDYIMVRVFGNGMELHKSFRSAGLIGFGSYGIGDAEDLGLVDPVAFEALRNGGFVNFDDGKPNKVSMKRPNV